MLRPKERRGKLIFPSSREKERGKEGKRRNVAICRKTSQFVEKRRTITSFDAKDQKKYE